jgi:hypothetical protein
MGGMGERRSFVAWFGDVVCGLSAYVLSRWIWKSVGTGPFDRLLEELATFAVLFLFLKALWWGLTRSRRRKA